MRAIALDLGTGTALPLSQSTVSRFAVRLTSLPSPESQFMGYRGVNDLFFRIKMILCGTIIIIIFYMKKVNDNKQEKAIYAKHDCLEFDGKRGQGLVHCPLSHANGAVGSLIQRGTRAGSLVRCQ